MFYYFDEAEKDKKIIKLKKCCKCIGDCYCATIDLDLYHNLHFGFFNENNEYELDQNMTFKLEIAPDPITNIIQRYGFEQNTNLPSCEENKDKLYAFENILNVIKRFFSTIFRKSPSI